VLIGFLFGGLRTRASVEPVEFTEVTRIVNGETIVMDIAHVGPIQLDSLPGSSVELFQLTGLRRISPVVFRYNATGGPSGFESQIEQGHTGWNGISSSFWYEYAGADGPGVSSNLCVNTTFDGKNSVNWGNSNIPNVLAMACWSASAAGSANECDILVDPNWDWGGTFDLQTVVLHESGHCAGLAHSQSSASVMASFYRGLNRIPLADDAAGICAIYGCPPIPLPTATPTFTITPVPNTPTITPTPTRTPTPMQKRAIIGGISRD